MKTITALWFTCVFTLAPGLFAQTPVSFFLKVDGIAGESHDPDHQGEIDLVSFKAGVMQHLLQSFAGGAASASKSDFLPVKVFKYVDKASPQLFLACATGQHIKNVVLTAKYEATSGGPNGDFFTITLSDVIVASVDSEGAEQNNVNLLLETVSFSYSKISWSYRPVNSDGFLEAPITGGFDVKTNRKL